MKRPSLTVQAAVLYALLSASGANAQSNLNSAARPDSQEDRSTATNSPSGGDEPAEVVVTARKRSESLLDVPISVTAITGDQLTKQGINSVTDLQNSVPNLQYSPRGDLENQISIRGVGGDPRNIGIESGVSLYVDGVFAGRTGGYNQDLANVSQIEVLRGPQGTLFGKNTTGGVINVITEKPSDEFSALLDGTYGNYNDVVVKGSVSGPIADQLFAGVTLASTTRDGYLHNLYDGRDLDNIDRRGGRLQLRWESPLGLNLYWAADRTSSTSDFALTQAVAPFVGAAAPYQSVNSRLVTDVNSSNLSLMDTGGVSQTADYTLPGDLVLTSVTAYRKTDVRVNSDADALPITLFNSGPVTDDSRMVSQEIRLASPDTGILRYVAGLYYYHETADALRLMLISGSLANGYRTNAQIATESVAGFANADLHPTSRLTITGGVRMTGEGKQGFFQQVATGKNYDFDDLHRYDRDVSWTGSVNYRIVQQLAVYASASRGFKSGGFNTDQITVAGETPNELQFKPERLTNFETGVKGRVWDGLLTFTGDVFYDNYNDKQVAEILGNGFPVTVIDNAGTARIKGFEADATLRPSSLWTVTGSASRLNTRYTNFPNAALVNGAYVSYTGNRLENAPAWSGDLAIDRRQPFRFGYLTARVEARYTGETYFQPDNLAVNLQSGYTLYDARLGFETQDGKTTVAAWGKNLGDKSYYTYSRQLLGTHQALYGEPRTFGIELIRKF